VHFKEQSEELRCVHRLTTTLLSFCIGEDAADTMPLLLPTAEFHASERTRRQGDESECGVSAAVAGFGDDSGVCLADSSPNEALDATLPVADDGAVRLAHARSSANEKLDCTSVS
jgi:hypothetical protein